MSNLWIHAAADTGEYFHGTITSFEPGDRITPAEQHSQRVNFPNVTDRGHAYATSDEDNAWHYAEKVWDAAPTHHPHFGNPPKVYRVRPLGPVEADPSHDEHGQSRDNFAGDVRSKHGFEVLHEVPMPEHMGEPEDWR